MKKIIFIMFTFALFLLVGCKTPGPDGGETGITEDEFNEKFDVFAKYVDENIPYLVTNDIQLVEEYQNINAIIEWSSSNEDVISFYGGINPDKGKAIPVTLTYKVMIENKEKEGTKDIIVSPVTVEDVQKRFEKQFSNNITRDYNVKNVFFDLFTVEWYSTDESLFDNNGKYHKPKNDTPFSIKYVIKYGNVETEEYTIDLVAIGQSDLEKLNEIKEWLYKEKMLDLYLTSEISLPTFYEPLGIEIKWSSTNEDVVSKDGKVRQYVFERYLTLIASYELGNGSGGSCKFECIVEALDISKMSEEEILENFLSAIAMDYYGGTKFGGNAGGCNLTYGHLNFYENKESEIVEMLLPMTNVNRTGLSTDVKFVVVHDTGNMSPTATAKANANFCHNNGKTSSTGWHYTVGTDGIFQTVPEGEIAYHANGSSDQYANFIKTNVKAQWKKPNFSISDDGFIMINNIKSDFRVPNVGKSVASDGPVWEIGEDGFYYISEMWFCSSFSTNATKGGNASSVGIESAVNAGTDYNLTSRILAKLVAEICMRHDVPLGRVVQHNTTSGKDCPNGMRSVNYWYTFKDIVNIEMFAKTYFKDYNFKWTGSGDIDDTGRIKLGTTANEVKYSVTVSKNGVDVLTKSYITKIN